jgi:glutamyl-tRNA(Gln) amidotransferase subunit D
MLEGYSGKVRETLEKFNIDIGDLILIKDNNITYEGLLMPRYEIFDPNYITIKLSNGYNVGIRYKPSLEIKLINKYSKSEATFVKVEQKEIKNKIKISFIGTGGTILSKIDYKTGAVKPSFNVEDLIKLVEEYREDLKINMIELFKIFSEDMTVHHWEQLSETIYNEFKNGSQGIIVAHGTDTLGYTAAALSFSLQNLSHPIVLVGAQRSLDRPSSDAALNLKHSLFFSYRSKYSGVYVVMHSTISDNYCHAYRGTRVRKMHTSARDAFKSINAYPVAKIFDNEIIYIDTEGLLERDPNRAIQIYNKFEEKVFPLKVFPSMNDEIIYFLIERGYKGILIEGTGLGHVPFKIIEAIKYAIEKGLLVAMSSQCLYGRVNMHVYEKGRLLLKAGVIGAEDMFPETALVKMMWSLGNAKDLESAKELFLKNIAGEISQRTI